MISSEREIEEQLIQRLRDLKYDHRAEIQDRAALERNFRKHFQALNRVELTDGEFQRLLDEIIGADVFSAAKTLRGINSFTRDDGTPLNYTLVNIKDWCKNTFEVVSQLRINTDYSHHRYDVLLLINGVRVSRSHTSHLRGAFRSPVESADAGLIDFQAGTQYPVRRIPLPPSRNSFRRRGCCVVCNRH